MDTSEQDKPIKKKSIPPVAPIGNKYGVGHGRPPNPGFSNEEVIALGEEMIEWINRPEIQSDDKIVHLSQWYSMIKRITSKEWDALQQRASFLPYYDQAIRYMGTKMLTNKAVPPAYGSRFLGLYFRDVHRYEEELKDSDMTRKREIIEHELKLKQTCDLHVTEQQAAQHRELIDNIKSIQSERKMEEINIKAEARS